MNIFVYFTINIYSLHSMTFLIYGLSVLSVDFWKSFPIPDSIRICILKIESLTTVSKLFRNYDVKYNYLTWTFSTNFTAK